MDIERLRKARDARPFARFILHLSDGRSVPVEHPEMIAIGPKHREVMVYTPDMSHHFIDVLHITEIEVDGAPGKNGASGDRQEKS